MMKGFGCQPVMTYLRALRASVRNPSPKRPFVTTPAGGRVVWEADIRISPWSRR